MTRLGLSLIFRTGREARGRLIATAIGIAISTALLLVLLVALNAMGSRDERRAWMESSAQNVAPSVDESTTDPMFMLGTYDYIGEQPIYRVTVAATGDRAPLLPGIPRNPGEGEYFLSPALAALTSRTEPDELSQRFQGSSIGIIGDDALTTPDMLLVIQGAPVQTLENAENVQVIRSLETHAEPYSFVIRILLALGGIGLLFPVVVFISTATRLAAASREQRFAALRLIGATPRQIRRFAALEAFISGVGGMALGALIFIAIRPAVENLPVFGGTFFAEDLTLSMWQVCGIAIVLLMLIVGASLLSLRRLQVSPLGVRQHIAEASPRPYGLLPLVIGVVLLAVPVVTGQQSLLGTGGQYLVILGGFLLVLLGIVASAPWLTSLEGGLLLQLSHSAKSLIAARRLQDSPKTVARATSGLALAVFVVSLFAGLASTAVNGASDPRNGGFPEDAVSVRVASGPRDINDVAPLVQRLESDPGVTGVVVVYQSASNPDSGFVRCADIPVLGLGACAGHAEDMVEVPLHLFLTVQEVEPHTWNAMTGPDDVKARTIIARTNGDAATIRRVQTTLVNAQPLGPTPMTHVQFADLPRPIVAELERLAYGGMVASVLVASCSLAVSVVTGILERKRAFGLLRLAGMQVRQLKEAVLLESAVPLLISTLFSACLGLLTAELMLQVLLERSMAMPGRSYFIVLGGSTLAAGLILLLTLSLIRRVTENESVRYE